MAEGKWVMEDGTRFTTEELEEKLISGSQEAAEALRGTLFSLARFYEADGRHDQSDHAWNRAMELVEDPEEKAGLLLGRGCDCEKRRDFETAAGCYAKGLPLEPTNSKVNYYLHNNLGFCLLQDGDYERAEVYCRSAIRIAPGRHNAHKNLGLSLQGQGEYEGAARSLLEAAELRREAGRALRHLRMLADEYPEVVACVPGVSEALKDL